MTCHTDDADAEKAYLDFVEHVEPELKAANFKLSQIYVQHPLRRELPKARYAVFDRSTEVLVELFRPENIPLETEEAKLSQQYQKLFGGLSVRFKGEDKTLPQMTPFQEDPDRALREETWLLVANRRLQEKQALEDLFDKLLDLRNRMAHNAGFPNYRDYTFRKLGRFDYTPVDCEQFHQAVEREVMPRVRRIQAERRRTLGLPALRPWDLAVDPLNRPALRPFAHAEEMVSRAQAVFDSVDAELAAGFKLLQQKRLLDLENRKGKAPGGYQENLSEARLPFIFMNAVGVQRDVETILHEAGHAFHCLLTRDEDLQAYRMAPMEFAEVASMSMELLGNQYLEKFYDSADADRARQTHLENIPTILAWIATVDAFQHWIYTHQGHTRAERAAKWSELMQRFQGDVDWSGLEEARSYYWHKQLHIFLVPFYYIEYGIAQLGALQVWANSKTDKGRAVQDYKNALALGGSKPLPDLFRAAGAKFDFSQQTIGPLMTFVDGELAKA
jgi:oligoendopeptidase F